MNEEVIAVLCLVLVFAGQPLVIALSPTNDQAPLTWIIETVDSARANYVSILSYR